MLYHSRMTEGVLVVEIEAHLDKAIMVSRLKSVTPTNGKQTGTVPKSLAEGGAVTPDRPIVTTCSNEGTVKNTATMKRNAEKRYETRLERAGSSQTTHRTLTTTIVTGYL